MCDHVIASVPSGGVCLNDCVVHFCASSLPFGGVGGSGLGHCHGKYSFEAFTHARGVRGLADHDEHAVAAAGRASLTHRHGRLLWWCR